MRNKCSILSICILALCFAVPAFAASSGTVDKKLEGFSISLPADWEVLTKQEMDALEGKPTGARMLLAATAKAPFPKVTAFDEEQGNLTQAEFEALSGAEVERMCSEFVKNIQSRAPSATNISCNRQKVAKGSALVVSMDLPDNGVRSSMWSFYRGPKKITVVSSLCSIGDSAQIKQTDSVLKSVKLTDK